VVAGAAGTTGGAIDLRFRDGAAGTTNPGTIWIESNRGGTAGPLTVANG